MKKRVPISDFSVSGLALETPVFICATEEGQGEVLEYGLVVNRGDSSWVVRLDNGARYYKASRRFNNEPAWMFRAEPDFVREVIRLRGEANRKNQRLECDVKAASERAERAVRELKPTSSTGDEAKDRLAAMFGLNRRRAA